MYIKIAVIYKTLSLTKIEKKVAFRKQLKKIRKQHPWIKQNHNITCGGFGHGYNMKMLQHELPKHNGNIWSFVDKQRIVIDSSL